MRRRRVVALLVSALSAAGLLACEYIIGLERPSGVDRPADDAPTSIDDPCSHVVPPPKNGDDAPTKELPPFWLAADSLGYAYEADGSVAGFDIDDSCTCAPDRRDGAAPCESFLPAGRVCDDPGGVDNELGRALSTFRQVFDISAYAANDIARGRRTLVLWISGYNGERNDSDVKASIVISDGLYSDLGCDDRARSVPLPEDAGCALDSHDGRCADGGVFPPIWDGCDRWHPQEGVVFSAGRDRAIPLRTVSSAYVSDGQLVVPYGYLPIFGPGQNIMLEEAVIVGRLVPTPSLPGRFSLRDGLIVGRAPLLDIAHSIGQTVANGEALCTLPFWSFAKTTMCRSLDTMTSSSQDFTGAQCNAFAIALHFSASPAELDDRSITPLVDESATCVLPDTVEGFCGDGGT